mmetsp:Transcript_2460/g.4326  ORF Transcript_2460/g.4326 Transcript_2460/m.4326 type:complete len:355 (-) Transcript_2460:1714-2778(-)
MASYSVHAGFIGNVAHSNALTHSQFTGCSRTALLHRPSQTSPRISMQYSRRNRSVNLTPVAPRPDLSRVIIPPGTRLSLDDFNPNKHHYPMRLHGLRVLKENIQFNSHFQTQLYAESQRSLLLIIHGMHTSGKSATIKRIITGMDPSALQFTHFSSTPSPIESKHDFLWRAHMRVPPKGHIGLWNKSHYEDVTAARVNGALSESAWTQRYEMINAFEKILALNGTKIVKIFLHISEDEQLSRLGMDALLPLKAWNTAVSDVEMERARWFEYMESWEDAISATSTDYAPWHVVPSNEKWARNAIVSEILSSSFRSMNLKYPSRVFRARRLVKRITKQYQKAGLIRGKVKRLVKVK